MEQAEVRPTRRPAESSGVGAPDGIRTSRRFGLVPDRGRASVRGDMLRRRMLACADAATLLASIGLLTLWSASLSSLFWVGLTVPAWILLAKLHGLYDRDHRSLRHLTVDELSSLLSWATMGAAVTAVLVSLTPAGAMTTTGAVRLWVLIMLIAPVSRAAVRRLWRTITPPEPTLLLGSGPLERATRRKIELFGDIHLELVGHLDDPALRRIVERGESLESDLVLAAGGRLPARLVLATQDVSEHLIAELVRFCRARRVKLSVVPPARGMFGTAVRLAHVAELPFIEYHTGDLSRSSMLIKRSLDIAGSTFLLVLLSPLLLLVAVLIRLDSPGPVFFTQVRGGREGWPFRILKFRSMHCDAEQRLGDLVDVDGLAEPMFKLRGDPRVTRIGRWLRRWSIDELPQLVNVLKGEMSLVGPRPEQMELVVRYAPEHRFRLAAKPGLTGPMQVYGRGELEFDERLAVEREYIENASLLRDLRILMLTVPALLSGKGAF
jgi:exopolysaccharide biosynthesis polyprenyl glycosylphosphotransferase